MPYELRLLTPQDQSAAWKLGSVAFGYHDREMGSDWTSDTSGRHTIGAFDQDGRLVAKAVDREQGHWFGGRLVPASGVAGVVVAPEHRGSGLGRQVLTRLLTDAHGRGAVISTLFPTTVFPYRRLGWEEVGAMTYTALPTADLAMVRPDREVTLRPAAETDFGVIQELYRSVAQAANGMMERSGPLFKATAREFLDSFDGVTIAVDAQGTIAGYASWDRGPGYDATGKITFEELIAATPAATASLVALAGSWASVAPTAVLRLPAVDPVWLLVSQANARVDSRQPWMLRIVDAEGAIAARGWPDHLNAEVNLQLEDRICAWNTGPYRLILAGGQARLEPGGTGQVRLGERGLGQWYAGVSTPAVLRRAGLLSGGDATVDAILLAATAGIPPVLHDYF